MRRQQSMRVDSKRHFCGTAPLCQEPTPEEYQEKVLQMQRQVNEDAATAVAEMKKLYGEDKPALGWMHNYLRSPHPEFMAPSLQLVSADPEMQDATEAAYIHFVAQLLRDLSLGSNNGRWRAHVACGRAVVG